MPVPTTAPPPFMLRQMTQPTMMLTGSADTFLPTQVGGCVLWLAADRLTGLADGASVAQWSDLSGRGNHATQVTGGKQPVFRVGQLNGLPGLLFNGTSSCLIVPSFTLTTACTVFIVGTLATGSRVLYEHSADSSANDGMFAWVTSSNPWSFRRSSTYSCVGTSNWLGAAPALATILNDGATTPSYYKNGTVQANGATAGSVLANTSVTTTLNIGSRNQVSLFASGYFYEMLIYTRGVSVSEQKTIERYLGTKYSLVVS